MPITDDTKDVLKKEILEINKALQDLYDRRQKLEGPFDNIKSQLDKIDSEIEVYERKKKNIAQDGSIQVKPIDRGDLKKG